VLWRIEKFKGEFGYVKRRFKFLDNDKSWVGGLERGGGINIGGFKIKEWCGI
jgi:hypothetical protein